MTKMKEIVGGTLVVALAAILFYFVGSYALEKTEFSDCMKWQQQAGVIQGFYVTQWQKDQCDYYKIEINAPVK